MQKTSRSAGLTFVVGGIYGRLGLLERVLETIQKRADAGTIVFLGNYGRGGEEGRLVVDRLIAGPAAAWQWQCLIGSDEDILLESAERSRVSGLGVPTYGPHTKGTRDYGAIPLAHLHWFASLTNIYEDRHRVYVHAAVHEDFGLREQPPEILMNGVYEEDDPGGYRGMHVVHAHVPSAVVKHLNRTAIEAFGRGNIGAFVAVFDDALPGGPIDLILVAGAEGSLPRPGGREGTVASLREGLAFEEDQLARLHLAMSKMDEVQRSNWPELVRSHQRAILQYRQRLADLERPVL